MNQTYPVIIIGAGPCGIAAAVQLMRHRIKPLIIEPDYPGGLLHRAGWVENYPGFIDGISGMALAQIMAGQLTRWAATIKQDTVTKLEKYNNRYKTHCRSGTIYVAQHVLIATGTHAKSWNNVLLNDRSSERVYDDIAATRQWRNQRIAVIGAGDVAFDYALQLAAHNDVVILNRTQRIKALSLLQKRVQEKRNIDYKAPVIVQELHRDGERLQLHGSKNHARWNMWVDAVVTALGRSPALEFLDPALLHDISAANNPLGLYWGGDARYGRCGQVGIAVGDGLKAAQKIIQVMTQHKPVNIKTVDII